MSSDGAAREAQSVALPAAVCQHWVLLIGFLLIALPTLVTLAQQVWATDAGAHAPIVLATGLWLISQNRLRTTALSAAAAPLPLLGLLIVALPLYVFGRAYDFISLEAAGLYIAAIAIVYRLVGARALADLAFPLFYLGFLIPPPGWVIDQITAPLRTFVSWVATEGLQMLGYPIAREGVALHIAQYQLLVEDACAGMNSIVGLTAISLFYIYVSHRASLRHALLLTLFILPIAVLANLVRVVVLVLLTYCYGDAVAQGFLHMTAGVLLFAVALLLVFALDTLLQRFFTKKDSSA